MKFSIKTYLYLVILVVLSIWYGIVMWWTINPQASDEYRMYYIKRNIIGWPGEDGSKVFLGETLAFSPRISGRFPLTLSEGWSHQTDEGYWSKTGDSVLYLRFPQPLKQPVEMHICCRGSNQNNSTGSLQLLLNNHIVQTFSLSTSVVTTHIITIPNTWFMSDHINKITFRTCSINKRGKQPPNSCGFCLQSIVFSYSNTSICL